MQPIRTKNSELRAVGNWGKTYRLSDLASILIRDTPLHQRPRERLMAEGAEQLDNASLIAILLRTGTKGSSAVTIAQQLLHRFQTLQRLATSTIDELRQVKGIGRDKAIALKSAFTLASRMARELRQDAPPIDTPAEIAALLRDECRLQTVEIFQILLLNSRHRLIRIEKLTQGTVDSTMVHPRDVFRAALAANAAAFAVVHNHPSGDSTPSDADVRTTRDLIRAAQLMRIEFLDHIIIGQSTQPGARDFSSMRELGYFFS